MLDTHLDPDKILAHLPPDLPLPEGVSLKLEVYAETASTNDALWRLGQAGAPEGRVIFAESQTRGRGTRGRAWESARGRGLWFSVLLRPTFPAHLWTRVTPALAVAVAHTLEHFTGIPAGIKWTNDVQLGGRKVCGILTEASISGPQPYVVAGLGLNILHAAADFPPELEKSASSLYMETGRNFPREEIAGHLLGEIFTVYAVCGMDLGFARILDEVRSRNVLLGRRVIVEDGQQRRGGTVTGIGEEGQLLLEDAAGPWETRSGTVKVS